MLKIIEISAEQTYKIRLDVLKTCPDYQYKYDADFESSSLHLGAFKDSENVGIVSLMDNNHTYFTGKQMQLRGMAVLKKVQGKGVGKILIDAIKKESLTRKATIIWCNARDYSVKFYEKQGFKIKGDKFFIKNVCHHYVMYIKL